MKNILITSFLYISLFGNILAQSISSNFSTDFGGTSVNLLSEIKLDCEYCLGGRIYIFNSTGELIYKPKVNSYSLEKVNIPMAQMLKLDKTMSFNIVLSDCNDNKNRGIDASGVHIRSSQDTKKYESNDSAITITLDSETQTFLEEMSAKLKEGDERKAKEEQALIDNEKRSIKVGDLLYICNGGTPCEVIAREVTPTKIKVEFISKCWPEHTGRISRWTHISQGHERWLEKKYIYGKEKVKCYGKQSAIR